MLEVHEQPTGGHEEWHAEFPGKNSPPKNL